MSFSQFTEWFANPPSIQPVTLAYALIAAAGMFLVLSSLGLFSRRGPRVQLDPRRISLEAEQERIENVGITRETGTIFERALAPIAQAAFKRTTLSEREWVERAYDLLDRQSGSSDFYLKKVLSALVGFAVGVTFGLIFAVGQGSLLPLLSLPIVLSACGFFLPKWELNADLAQRREQMLFEVPYVLDKLCVNILATNSVIMGLEKTVERAEGGYLMREMLQVVEDNAKNGRLQQAFQRMADRNTDAPLVSRVALRLAMSEETGANIVRALQSTGDRAIEVVENMIQERGERNNLLMVAPSMIALLGVLIAIVGPSATQLSALFQ